MGRGSKFIYLLLTLILDTKVSGTLKAPIALVLCSRFLGSLPPRRSFLRLARRHVFVVQGISTVF